MLRRVFAENESLQIEISLAKNPPGRKLYKIELFLVESYF